MMQVINDKAVYVVDLKEMPVLPIVGTGVEQYYAEALTEAISQGLVTIPGKYGISIDWSTHPARWEAHKIIEEELT